MVRQRYFQLQAAGRSRSQGRRRLWRAGKEHGADEVCQPRNLPHLARWKGRQGLVEGRCPDPQRRSAGRDRGRQKGKRIYQQTQKVSGSQLRSPGLFACLSTVYFFAAFFAAFFGAAFLTAFFAGAFFAAAFFAGAFFAAAFLAATFLATTFLAAAFFFGAAFFGAAFFAAGAVFFFAAALM